MPLPPTTRTLRTRALTTAACATALWLFSSLFHTAYTHYGSWSVGLLRESGHVLLDRQAPDPLLSAIREAIEARAGDRVSDLHVWRISPEGWSAIVSVVSADPLAPDGYRALLPDDLGLAHVNVEVLPCPHAGDATGNGEA